MYAEDRSTITRRSAVMAMNPTQFQPGLSLHEFVAQYWTEATDENLEHPTFAVIEPVRTFERAAITDWCQRRLAPDAEGFTDGVWAFRRFANAGHAHTVLKTGGVRATTEANGPRWVNIVLGNVKRSISGRYRSNRQVKCVRPYLAEAAYRFDRRFRLSELLTRLARAMMLCAPCPDRSLRLAENVTH